MSGPVAFLGRFEVDVDLIDVLARSGRDTDGGAWHDAIDMLLRRIMRLKGCVKAEFVLGPGLVTALFASDADRQDALAKVERAARYVFKIPD